MQATYTLVLEQLTANLEALREECHQTALASQALIRSNLDQIMSSHCFLEEKVRGAACWSFTPQVWTYLKNMLMWMSVSKGAVNSISGAIIWVSCLIHSSPPVTDKHFVWICVCLPECICEDAEKVCSECVAPYMSSILEALTEHISAGIQGMRHTLHTRMDSAFTHTNGGTPETKKVRETCVSSVCVQLSFMCTSFVNLSLQCTMCHLY